MKIYEFVGDKNNQGLVYGDPLLAIGFCDGEWELAKTNWNDVRFNTNAVLDLHDNLMVDFCVTPEIFEDVFRFSCEII